MTGLLGINVMAAPEGKSLDILQVLYFYTPYTSGLTIYAERLSREFIKRGHRVTVLASWHDRSLPRESVTEDGARVVRVPIAANLSRAVIMPGLLPTAARLLPKHDVMHLHLPMAEAGGLAALGRAFRKRVVVTHHSDLVLDGSRIEKIAAGAGMWSGILSGRLAGQFVTYTHDRAAVSPTVTRVPDYAVIPPPIEIPTPSPDASRTFREKHGLGSGPVIGYAGRFAVEKGLDILMETIPAVQAKFPHASYALAGPYLDGRDNTPLKGPWDPYLEKYASSIHKLGVLSGQELADFYAACDVLVLPSINWTETFGLVQVEAMLCGTPSICSDLPGVREAVRITGMGRTAIPGDARDLGEAIIDVVGNREKYLKPAAEINERFSLPVTIDAYERVYRGEKVELNRPGPWIGATGGGR
jgi:glycosyltransferase involved in cell wall biosynthesis